MKYNYDIKPRERLEKLGYSNKELRLYFYFEKSRRKAKLKRLISKNIVDTQKKGWC
jgi:hypothetical protein